VVVGRYVLSGIVTIPSAANAGNTPSCRSEQSTQQPEGLKVRLSKWLCLATSGLIISLFTGTDICQTCTVPSFLSHTHHPPSPTALHKRKTFPPKTTNHYLLPHLANGDPSIPFTCRITAACTSPSARRSAPRLVKPDTKITDID